MQKRDRQVRRFRKRTKTALSTNVTLHLPVTTVREIRSIANECGLPSETLMKIWIAEKVLNRKTPTRAL